MDSKDVMHLFPSRRVRQLRSILLRWGKSNFQRYPWRRTRVKWHGLVAEVLLQRTKASAVAPVYRQFIVRFPTPQNAARAKVSQILDVIRPLGLPARAPLLKKLGEAIAAIGKIPMSIDELSTLPGIGPYIAGAWVSFHARGRGVIIDANVVRLLCRLCAVAYNGETRRKRWVKEMAERLTPKENSAAFNYALLDFTMTICIPVKPKCQVCPIGPRLCEYGRQYFMKAGKEENHMRSAKV